MITNITLDHKQIRAIIADACNGKTGDVTLTEAGAVPHSADVVTDLKGAQKVQRIIDRMTPKT